MMNKNSLILVTGATSGIGKATAELLAKSGYRVAFCGRDTKRLNDLVKTLDSNLHRGFTVDLTEIEKIPHFIAHVETSFGSPIDAVVHCAGDSIIGRVEDIPLEAFRKHFELGFFSTVALVQGLIPSMKRKRSGHFVFLTSGAGKRGLPGLSAYSSSKFALYGLIDSLRVELQSFGIHVTAVSPGQVNTELAKRAAVYGGIRKSETELGIEPHVVAQAILKCLENPVREINLSLKTNIGLWLNKLAPKLMDKILSKRYQVPSGSEPR